MIDKAVRRAAAACIVLSIAALVASTGVVHDTLALFNGETTNAGSTFAGGWIDPPSGASAGATGYDVAFAWTPGTHGPVTGQQLWGADNAANSNCTGAAYTSLATLAAAAATYTDANRGSSANGDWYCYKLVSTSATVWTAEALLPALQVGLVATSVSVSNGGTSGTMDKNDTITITFNQRTNIGSSSVTVCSFTNGTVLIGDANGGACSAGDPSSIGKLSGATIGSNASWPKSGVSVSTSAPWTVTVTLAGAGKATESGTLALTPASTVKSFATTDQASICTSSSSTCQPTTSSHF